MAKIQKREMRVPVKSSKGLYLKYFVLRLDGSDPFALEALLYYAEQRADSYGNSGLQLLMDVRKLIKAVKTSRGKTNG